MRTRLLITLIVGLLGVVMLVIPSIGGADPDLNNVAAHRHFLVVAGSNPLVFLGEIGPDLCDNPNLQNAFNQFHNNLHIATASSIGPVAPGLHDGEQAELVSRGCTFHP
jgi:hypothetical protein